MSCRLSVGPHIFIKGTPGHWNRSRPGAPFPFRRRDGSNPATSLTAVRRTSRPWSTSYDTALPMLRSRSVTGLPHHLSPQLCRVPASTGRSPKPLRPGAAPGRHGAALLRRAVFHWGCGSTRKAPALQAVSCGSVTRHLHHFNWELPRLADCKSAVTKRVGRRPVERYHQLPPLSHTHAMGSEAEVVEAHGCQPCH